MFFIIMVSSSIIISVRMFTFQCTMVYYIIFPRESAVTLGVVPCLRSAAYANTNLLLLLLLLLLFAIYYY